MTRLLLRFAKRAVSASLWSVATAVVVLPVRSGRSVAVAVEYSLPFHINVLPAPKLSLAILKASLKLLALSILLCAKED